MHTSLRVLKNSTALSISVLLERGIAFILPWYVARILGREAWGDFNTAYSFILIGAALAPGGLMGLLPRQIARDRKLTPAAAANGSVLGLISGVATALIMLLIVLLLDYEPSLELLIMTGILTVIIPRTLDVILETIFQGLEQMEWIVLVRLPATVIRVVFSIILLEAGMGIEILFYALLLYHILTCLFYWTLLRRQFPDLKLRFNPPDLRNLFLQAIPFFLIISITETFRQADRIFLSKLWDSDAVGIYATGALFIQLLYMFAPALMGALFPGLSRTYTHDRERFSYLVSWFFKLLGILMFPMTLLIISYAGLAILLVFGPEYTLSVPVFRLLALGIVPTFLSRIMYRAILASDNERLAVRVSLVANGANLLLNILLIPSLGVLGASLAVLGTILVNFAQNFRYALKVVRFDYWQALWKPLLCMTGSLAVYIPLFQSGRPGAAGWAATAVFLIAVFGTGTLGRRDFENMHFIRRKKVS
jgi:O-antigen/teichoic acid export membrane protein